jgi:CRISPR-associated protein Cas2
LRRVAKAMQSYGERVQKSVFECSLSRQKFSEMRGQVAGLIRPDADDVRFYPLFAHARHKQTVLGGGVRPSSPKAYFV